MSRELTAAYVKEWDGVGIPGGKVIVRDLTATSMPPVSGEWVGRGIHSRKRRGRREQKKLLELSDTLIAELERADEYVVGVPMPQFQRSRRC